MSMQMGRAKVLVCAQMSDPSIALLNSCAEVDVRVGLSASELLDVIDGYEALVINSQVLVGADVIERGRRLRIIGGTDAISSNVDMPAARSRGISVVSGQAGGQDGALNGAVVGQDVLLARQLTDLMGEIDNLMSLRVVDIGDVFAHESVDARRVAQLADWLTAEKRLLHPPLVMKVGTRYVILDGATRIAALKELGYRHAIVQIVADRAQLNLFAWFHALRHRQPQELLAALRRIEGLIWRERSAGYDSAAEREARTVCTLQGVDGEGYTVYAAGGVDSLDAANLFSEAYTRMCHVSRTVSADIDALRQEYPDVAALVRYPQWRIEDVLRVASSGRVLPAGITRFVIPGRVLRLNVDLERLAADLPLAQKNEWLIRLLLEKKATNRVRYYGEPVYLLDD